jgi:hypothetical protein
MSSGSRADTADGEINGHRSEEANRCFSLFMRTRIIYDINHTQLYVTFIDSDKFT